MFSVRKKTVLKGPSLIKTFEPVSKWMFFYLKFSYIDWHLIARELVPWWKNETWLGFSFLDGVLSQYFLKTYIGSSRSMYRMKRVLLQKFSQFEFFCLSDVTAMSLHWILEFLFSRIFLHHCHLNRFSRKYTNLRYFINSKFRKKVPRLRNLGKECSSGNHYSTQCLVATT